ncbi:MAG: tetratricopeptide repeat protein [Archangium sp.]|nr:tetratricopeptide repeat protein [Archangium sp.]MDP3152804.1 tetratricopeptide repeat protein [Archangium sp.]MDP3571720.1 tetratricopeptide repeat protein [Archangium sp.]
MSKPMLEKYEQMLAQDPSSTVFVELARAYLDRGDNDRAITTCQQGVTHHPNSVVGRVLWGKALINTGKAADAMKQFDLAVNIDRENPHAYNLIGEALLRKGLYRSALPILRRAATLQPNDGRIAQWLDQTKQALAGGPAPVLYDSTSVDQQALAAAAAAAAAPPPPAPEEPDVFASFTPAKHDPDAQPTVLMNAYTPVAPNRSAPPVPTGELPVITGSLEEEPRSTQELPAQLEPPDPFAAMSPQTDEQDTFRGLTSTFDALSSNASTEVPASAPRGSNPNTEPSVVVNPGLSPPVVAPGIPVLQPAPPAGPAGMLDDVVSAQSELPTSEFQMPGMNQQPRMAAPAVKPRSSGGLLDEIPDDSLEPPSAPNVPNVQFNTQATEAIAKEYERELRAKLEVTKQKKTFMQSHGLKLAAAAAALVILGGLGGSFVWTRVKNQGETLDTSIAKGLSAVNADTREQYGAAVRALEHALKMDEGNPEALSLFGFAKALLYAEHGGVPADRDAAVLAFSNPAARNSRPDLALVVDFLTADEAGKAAARQQLLGSDLDKATVKSQAGRLLLADKKYDEALAQLKKATELDPRNTRALVALGDYYLAFEDWDTALEMLSRAESLSKYHPARVIGHAEARLELGRELPEALADLEGLPKNAEVPTALKGRYALMLGRALSANGKHDEALKTLAEGQPLYTQYALEFAMALGHAQRTAGLMAQAQKSFEDALKLAPKSETAKEGLGRVLLARSREKELIDRLKPEKDARKVALLRGIAFFRMGEAKKARAELTSTQVNGKYPAEAAVYLALADASEEGQSEKATETLEKFAATLRRNKATVQVALARVYMQKGALDKARTQLEEAAKDPQDYEGNALLGELLLKAGVPPEVAMEPLTRAVERNGSHGPSRHLLTRTLLALGKVPEAVKQIEAWTQDNPALEQAWRDAALVYLQAGRLKEAEAASAKVSQNAEELEVWRTKALILFARGDGKNAMSALEKANKLNPKDAETFCEIGNAFVRQGNNDTAVKAFEAALREDPKSVCGLAGPLHAKPVAKGKPSPRDLLGQLITRSTNAWEKGFLQATLARVHLAGNDVQGARSAVDEAMVNAPFHSAVWFAAAEVSKREKDEAKAVEQYGKAAELDGSWSQARLAYADGLAKQGGDSLPKAVAQYEAVMLIDQNENDLARVKKTVAALKKQLSQ